MQKGITIGTNPRNVPLVSANVVVAVFFWDKKGLTRKRRSVTVLEKGVDMKDVLNMDHINGLPQPFVARFCGGYEWPIHDIDVETGLLRIDVCGKLQVRHISEVMAFKDADGVDHDSDSFYLGD